MYIERKSAYYDPLWCLGPYGLEDFYFSLPQ